MKKNPSPKSCLEISKTLVKAEEGEKAECTQTYMSVLNRSPTQDNGVLEVSRHLLNNVAITGVLTAREQLRYTPARIAVLEFRLQHQSLQLEAGVERKVECELALRALDLVAQEIALLPLGTELIVEGFLAARSLRNMAPVVHVNKIKLLEGIENGFQTETR